MVMMNILRRLGRGPAKTDLVSKINQQLVFNESRPLTLGVECEFGVVDKATYLPANVALDIVRRAGSPTVQYELYQHMLEITTGVCASVQEAERDLSSCLERIRPHLQRHNAALVGAGSLPLLMLDQAKPVETERYQMLRETRQQVYRRFTTQGMHIHLGMKDALSCIRYHNFYMRLLPHIMVLSANSPFEEGRDTGFDSIRPSVTESMPTGGAPYHFSSWQDYKNLCRALARSRSITDLKDLWWDLRPCPRYGTLEIRICDQPSTLAEVTAIAAFVHCLGLWFAAHQDWLDEMARPNAWLMRENKWRAMRYGLSSDIVVNNSGDTRPIRDDILQWIERLNPFFEEQRYEAYRETLYAILARGNGAARQRAAWRAQGRMEDVYAQAIGELLQNRPQWSDEKPPAPQMVPSEVADYCHMGQGIGVWWV